MYAETLCLYAYIREYDCVWVQNHDDIIVIDVAMMTSSLLMSLWWHHCYWCHHVLLVCALFQETNVVGGSRKVVGRAARLWDKNDYLEQRFHYGGRTLLSRLCGACNEGRGYGPAGQTLAKHLRWRPLGLAVHTSESALRSSQGIPGRSTTRRATSGKKKEVIFIWLYYNLQW